MTPQPSQAAPLKSPPCPRCRAAGRDDRMQPTADAFLCRLRRRRVGAAMTEHRGITPIHQLPAVTFHQQALDAILSLALTVVPGTKGSAVSVWQGTAEARRHAQRRAA